MKFAAIVAGYSPYVAWGLVSAAALLISRSFDPYVFGLVTFLSAGISGLFSIAALFLAPRRLLLAAASALPSVGAFAVLSTYRWA